MYAVTGIYVTGIYDPTSLGLALPKSPLPLVGGVVGVLILLCIVFLRIRNMELDRNDPLVPVGIGNGPAQQRFIQRHLKYVTEIPKVIELCNKILKRTLEPPDKTERQALLDANLPDDDPAVLAWEDRVTADRLIFHFGLMAADDFTSIQILAGNGVGFAAFVHVRSLYERLVTAMYIASKPSEARRFAEFSAIDRQKYLNNLLKLTPELKNKFDGTEMERIKNDAKNAKAKLSERTCENCGNPIPGPQGWTKMALPDMAKAVDPELEKMYGAAYLEGTMQGHANALGMQQRLEETASGYTYKGPSEAEADVALYWGHKLLLWMLNFQNGHFKLGLDEDLSARVAEFNAIWV